MTAPIQEYLRKSRLTLSGWTMDWVTQPGVEDGHDRAVFRRRQVEIAHRGQTACTRHVLHDDRRIARNVISDVMGQNPRIVVVSAGGRIADHDGEELALVEIVGARRRDERQQADQHEGKNIRSALEHRYPAASGCGRVGSRIGSTASRSNPRYYCAFSQALLRQNAADPFLLSIIAPSAWPHCTFHGLLAFGFAIATARDFNAAHTMGGRTIFALRNLPDGRRIRPQ